MGELDKIWIPQIIFANTESNIVTTLDEKSIGKVIRNGTFKRSLLEEDENIYKFRGDQNPIVVSRVYETDWICKYDLRWYPFDTQWCTMEFKTTEDLGIFVNLTGVSHVISGPTELIQYFIRGSKLFMRKANGGLYSVVFELSLGRRLTAVSLTAFLPTILLNVIGHATNYFKDFFFEAVVTVNLTVMLVLTTMFISISSSLPVTSYVKMIDVWLLFNLMVPFVEVLLHTWKDTLRDEEDREVNHHGRVRQFDVDGNEISPDVTTSNVDPIKIMDDGKGGFNIDLISRNENTQVQALEAFYANAITSNARRLKQLDRFGHVVIPRVALSFVTLYWILGLTKFNNPDQDFTDILISPLLILGVLIGIVLSLLISKTWK